MSFLPGSDSVVNSPRLTVAAGSAQTAGQPALHSSPDPDNYPMLKNGHAIGNADSQLVVLLVYKSDPQFEFHSLHHPVRQFSSISENQ